jgi:hypothetical protein
MKHNLVATANATAITVGFVYIACALLVALFPAFFKLIANSWFHGMDLSVVWTGTPRGNFVLGLISAMLASWPVGYIFAWTYNRFVK